MIDVSCISLNYHCQFYFSYHDYWLCWYFARQLNFYCNPKYYVFNDVILCLNSFFFPLKNFNSNLQNFFQKTYLLLQNWNLISHWVCLLNSLQNSELEQMLERVFNDNCSHETLCDYFLFLLNFMILLNVRYLVYQHLQH